MKKVFPYLFFFSLLFFAFSYVIGLENRNLINFSISEDVVENILSDEFGIIGPEELCLYYGSIIGDYSGGGLDTDVFSWKIFSEDGTLLTSREGGFQTFSYTFSELGIYKVQLDVRRGTTPVYSGEKEVVINKGADLILENSYLICENAQIDLTLINPSSPDISDYEIEWKNSSGDVIGNANTITINQPGSYVVDFHTRNEEGDIICPFSLITNVSIPIEYTISSSSSESCDGWNEIELNAGRENFGSWFYQKEGSEDRVLIGNSSIITMNPGDDLDGPGDYQLIFVVDNSENKYCKPEDSLDFKVNPFPFLEVEIISDTDDCIVGNGEVLVIAKTDIDELRLFNAGQFIENFGALVEGDTLRLNDLNSGTYSFRYGLGPCLTWSPFVIEIAVPIEEMKFSVDVISETCNETGKENGLLIVTMDQLFTGKYRVLDVNGFPVPDIAGDLIDVKEFEISLRAGRYYIELINEVGCIVSSPEPFRIFLKDQVLFDVPEKLTVCQTFDLYPYTEQDLKFTLFYPNGEDSTKLAGDFFVLNQSGDYRIVGTADEGGDGSCPREKLIRVTVTDPIEFEPLLRDEDCFGNKTYEAIIVGETFGNVQIKWYNEKDEIVGTGRFLYPISYGDFKLEVRPINSEGCPDPFKIFKVDKPVFELDIDISSVQYCYPETFSILTVDTDFDEAKSFQWILYDQNNNPIALPQFNDQSEIRVGDFGAYEVVAFSEIGCEIGRKYVEIERREVLAEFEIPQELIVCNSYELIPETELDIIFRVTTPAGDEKEYMKGESVILDTSGSYIFESMEDFGNTILCRVIKNIDVTIVRPVPFEPELLSEDCEGNFVYKANIYDEDTESVDYYWYNQVGELIGQEQNIELKTYGTFSLEVRPKGSLPCSEPPKTFEIIEPITELEVNLIATPLCPDTEISVISIETQFEFVNSIEWYFVELDGQRIRERKFQNEKEIAVDIEGTYEVEVLNHLGCVLGSNSVLILRSTDEVRPQTEEEYIVCEYLGKGEIIDPGTFNTYEWYLGSSLVSNEKTLLPTKAGNYTLIVTSEEGCQYSASFEVVENCSFEVMFPTAIDPQNPEKNFIIYTNYLVDEVDVWIYNKWGDLLFYCHNENLMENQASCIWDGVFNGEKIQIGAYAVKIQYRNKNEEGFKSLFGNISVLN